MCGQSTFMRLLVATIVYYVGGTWAYQIQILQINNAHFFDVQSCTVEESLSSTQFLKLKISNIAP